MSAAKTKTQKPPHQYELFPPEVERRKTKLDGLVEVLRRRFGQAVVGLAVDLLEPEGRERASGS